MNTKIINKFPCPKCKQPAGKDCKLPSSIKYDNIHKERFELATDQIKNEARITKIDPVDWIKSKNLRR